MLMKIRNVHQNSKVQNFEKWKKWFGDMVDSYLSTNLALIWLMVSEKTYYTDGQMMPLALLT